MRFITEFRLISLFLSLSIAAPIAQYFESVPAGNEIDNGEFSSNKVFADALPPSSPGVAVDNEFLMAARPQRQNKSRFRPSQQPPLKGSIQHGDICQPGSPRDNCQTEPEPTSIPVEEQLDSPHPLPDDTQEAGEGALGIWGLWNLLNDPGPAVSN